MTRFERIAGWALTPWYVVGMLFSPIVLLPLVLVAGIIYRLVTL